MSEGFLIGIAIVALGSMAGCLAWVRSLIIENRSLIVEKDTYKQLHELSEKKVQTNYDEARSYRHQYEAKVQKDIDHVIEIHDLQKANRALQERANELNSIPGTRVDDKGALKVENYTQLIEWLGKVIPGLTGAELIIADPQRREIRVSMR